MQYSFRCTACEHVEDLSLDPSEDDLLEQACPCPDNFPMKRVFTSFAIHQTFKPGVDHSTGNDYGTKRERDLDYKNRGLVPYEPQLV